MTNEEFENRMKVILEKVSDASDMDFTWHLVSGDPDCIADFGCDANGNLVLMEESFPLKISDLTNIRYRVNVETDASDSFLRFDFGEDIHLDWCFGDLYLIKYHDSEITCLEQQAAISRLKKLVKKYKADSSDFSEELETQNSMPEKRENQTSAISQEIPVAKEECAVRVGDNITFGSYPQSMDAEKSPVEWTVIAVEDGKALLISKYALDTKQYYEETESITWENCTLRKWLNGAFLNTAFNAMEQAQIQSTSVFADENPKCGTDPGDTTTDKVFLLSITETEKYFSSDRDRKCVPTTYAIAQGAGTAATIKKDGAATCLWWLRSPGHYQKYAAYVDINGSVYFNGVGVYERGVSVRPVLWINL